MKAALVLSGGNGYRIGKTIPKQYLRIRERLIITYSLTTLCASCDIDAIQIVADDKWRADIIEDLHRWGVDTNKIRGFSQPGTNRQYSILNGLHDIYQYSTSDDDLVLIHDAARPRLTREQVSDCIKAAKGHDGCMPVLPMKDTVYLSADGSRVSQLLPREQVVAGQAPEVFNLKKYLSAMERLTEEQMMSIHGSTEPAIMAGMDIAIVPGDEGNFKITTPQDLTRFEEWVKNNSVGE